MYKLVPGVETPRDITIRFVEEISPCHGSNHIAKNKGYLLFLECNFQVLEIIEFLPL